MVNIRRAGVADAALLARLRAALWYEITDYGAAIEPDAAVWAPWFSAALACGTYVSWIAEAEGGIIGVAGLLEQVVIPRASHPSGRQGRVQGVYIEPVARGRGVGRLLMQQMMQFAKDEGFYRLTLHPTDEARPLYTSLGFTASDEMELSLS